MGNKISRKHRNRHNDSNPPPNDVHIYDDNAVNKLREDLYQDTEKFLLNNILMSIQFYENFEREMQDLRKNQVSVREMEINKTLADYQKHCLLPDTVMECINERVRFRSFHGSKKWQSEPLLPQRIYIVHDNIEVIYEGETSEYSIVDGPIHRAVIEKADKQGYVQLMQVEFLNVKRHTEDSDSEDEHVKSSTSYSPKYLHETPIPSPAVPISGEKQRKYAKNGSAASSPLIKESQSVFFQTDNVVSESNLSRSDSRSSTLKKILFKSGSFSVSSSQNTSPTSKIRPSNSEDNLHKENEKSGAHSESEDYGYTTFTRISTQKPLDEVRAKRNPSDASSLSQYCITEVKVRKIDLYDDIDIDNDLLENGKRKPPVKKKIPDFYEIKRYFNSVEFFAHFGDVFANIYPLLQFTEESFRNAMTQGGVIHCDANDQNNNKVSYEVIPTVATAWPNIAFEWYMRQRRAVLDPTKNMVYQWPTKNMVKKIKSLQSNVLPFGYVAKRGLHENNALEWSLSFPAAERYLETCMSHSQVRCYLFILALYKTFMEQSNTKLGLTPHHIRTLIFWEIEKNFVTWPEERLGSKIMHILKNLYKHLSMGYLADYFVRERNLLESTPRKYLGKSQVQLHHILERPVQHVIVAMRNLRYTTGSFFPTLNFKKLYSIITTTDSLSIINPALANMVVNNTEQAPVEEHNEFKENAIPFWNVVRKVDHERKWKRKLRKQIEMEKKQEDQKRVNMRKQSVDSINLQDSIPPFDTIKRRALLEFFITHFVALASKCCSYDAYAYALVILNHCQALATLLGEEPSGEVEARPWKARIKEQIQVCMDKKDKVETISVRDSRQFTATTFNVSGNHSLNMRNLQNTFNNNVFNLDPPKKKKSRPQDLKITADVHSPQNTSPRSIILDASDDSTDL